MSLTDVTDASGSPTQVLDYYPNGSTRVTQQFGTFNEAKQFIFFGLMTILGVCVLVFGQQ